jgi:hypothetical protein
MRSNTEHDDCPIVNAAPPLRSGYPCDNPACRRPIKHANFKAVAMHKAHTEEPEYLVAWTCSQQCGTQILQDIAAAPTIQRRLNRAVAETTEP